MHTRQKWRGDGCSHRYLGTQSVLSVLGVAPPRMGTERERLSYSTQRCVYCIVRDGPIIRSNSEQKHTHKQHTHTHTHTQPSLHVKREQRQTVTSPEPKRRHSKHKPNDHHRNTNQPKTQPGTKCSAPFWEHTQELPRLVLVLVLPSSTHTHTHNTLSKCRHLLPQ